MAKGIKTGGRQKGTPNKVTRTLREILEHSISQELESLPKLLNQLEPNERINAIIKLIPYVMPKADKEEDKGGTMGGHTAFVENILQQINTSREKDD